MFNSDLRRYLCALATLSKFQILFFDISKIGKIKGHYQVVFVSIYDMTTYKIHLCEEQFT